MIIFSSVLIIIIKVFFLKCKEAMHQDRRNEFVLFEEGDSSTLNIAKISTHLFLRVFE